MKVSDCGGLSDHQSRKLCTTEDLARYGDLIGAYSYQMAFHHALTGCE
jgi:hypothetical protein